MREIKFRCFYRGEMKFVSETYYGLANHFHNEDFSPDSENCSPLMQFVINATNGDDVYEGDIVLLPADQLCKIEWKDTMFIAIAINPPSGYPREYTYWSAKEVVGNIYENKELL